MVGGNIVNYEGDPLEVIDRPKRIAAIRINNEGKWYNPPTSHLGKRFISDCALDIALAGFGFYESYLEQVEEKFFNKEPYKGFQVGQITAGFLFVPHLF
jgi:hypothetical protein